MECSESFEEELDTCESQGVLRLTEVSKKYGKFTALDKISVRILTNEITCIVGKNGSGKTTLMNIISSYEKPSSG